MTEWNHPRRAAKETLSYLSQVEPVIDEFAEDNHGVFKSRATSGGGEAEHEDDDDVGREQMLENVLEELKHQTASIMEDRHGSVVAEKIARRLTPLQLRVMLSRCRGYMLSLSNNRYSSHVLQTLLSLVGQTVEAEIPSSDATVSDNRVHQERSTPSINDQVDLMQDIVVSLVAELKGTWAELLYDVSGSHTGRGFLQVLGGLPILSEKRGKQSRHAHSIRTAVGAGSIGTTPGGRQDRSPVSPCATVDPEAFEKWSTPLKYRVPPSFKNALADVTAELSALSAGDLQAFACSTSGCPLLVMLLRVYANLAVDPASGRLPSVEPESPAIDLVKKILQWEDKDRSVKVVYAMSGESTASHLLEAVLWLLPEEFFRELYHRCFENSLLEFCEHNVSNFLIQAVLQRVEDSSMAEEIVGAISNHALDLLRARRAGVLWRAAQACVRLRLKPQIQTQLLGDVGAAVLAGQTGAASRAFDAEVGISKGEVNKKDSRAASDPFKSAREWVPALLSPRLPGEAVGESSGLDRLFLNVSGARIVQNALLFDPPVAAPVVKAVSALPEAVLAAVARDNIGSRCLLDPILDEAAAGGARRGNGNKARNKPAEDARRTILRAFKGHLLAMACDRVGWHVVLKCFRGVDMKEKRTMVEQLASGGEHAQSRMSACPSGRNVLTECMVERFLRSPREWEDAFRNRENRVKILDDILALGTTKKEDGGRKHIVKTIKIGSSSSQERPVGGNSTGGGKGDISTEEGVCISEKGKRRRQRGRGKRGKSSVGQAADMDEAGRDGAKQATESDSGDSFNQETSVLQEKSSTGVGKGAGKVDSGAEVQIKSRKGSKKIMKHQDSQEGDLFDVPGVTTTTSEQQSIRIAKKDKKAKKRKCIDEVIRGDQCEEDSVVVGKRGRKSTVSVNELRGKANNKREEDNKDVLGVVVEEGHVRSRKRRKSKSSGGDLRLF